MAMSRLVAAALTAAAAVAFAPTAAANPAEIGTPFGKGEATRNPNRVAGGGSGVPGYLHAQAR